MLLRSKTNRFFVNSLVLFILLVFPRVTWAAVASPMQTIRSGTEKVLSILQESKTTPTSSLRQREGEILKVVSNYFNFNEMAKMALGFPWKQQTPEKREEFARLFKKLLFNTYVDRMENYHDQKIYYDSQTIDGNFATVKTHFVSNGQSVPIDYRLQKEGDKWKVYDVVVEGISYDQNYRAQISSILANESFDTLLGMLREKVKRPS
ncbi:MAG: ABC transporter substrate-binding protein [Deltaproteobacteria bacterium]|nr:ABC transporter substrate-binding protein [Deltaproteobacteria bacterium]